MNVSEVDSLTEPESPSLMLNTRSIGAPRGVVPSTAATTGNMSVN